MIAYDPGDWDNLIIQIELSSISQQSRLSQSPRLLGILWVVFPYNCPNHLWTLFQRLGWSGRCGLPHMETRLKKPKWGKYVIPLDIACLDIQIPYLSVSSCVSLLLLSFFGI